MRCAAGVRLPKAETDAVAEFYLTRGKVQLDPDWPGLPEWDMWLSVARWLRHPRPDLLALEYPEWWLSRTIVRMNAENEADAPDE